ncbi:MAG: NAD(P)-dependent oxidoreductase [Alicyclobacillaceae bacterium]|nr:NAD(P)-dependent oxidoreductase [Alicyclobacillaceae bacterium]
MAKVAVIGLGVMGSAMARRLHRQGHEVVVYNRTRQKADRVREACPGIGIAASPAEAAASAAYVITMVADDEALAAVADGLTGLLAGLQGSTWIDMSTVSPAASRRYAEQARACGGLRVEAPVSGSVDAAENGTLLVFTAGEEDACRAVEPLLSDMAREVRYVGAYGQALAVKLAINLNIGIQMIGFSEGLLLAERAGLPRERAIDFMLSSVIASPLLKYRVPFIENPPEEPWFTNRLMLKDHRLALDEAHQRRVTLLLTNLAADVLRMACAHGYADEELALVSRFLGELNGDGQPG